MLVSNDKSPFLKCNIGDELDSNIRAIFPYKMDPIEVGFKYLGFWVKPLNYYIIDWKWLVNKFEARVGNWTYQTLSLCGILSYSNMY